MGRPRTIDVVRRHVVATAEDRRAMMTMTAAAPAMIAGRRRAMTVPTATTIGRFSPRAAVMMESAPGGLMRQSAARRFIHCAGPFQVPPGRYPVRVLVVEDEPQLLRAVAKALREEGYAVDEAADGEDALFKATATPYDAVVLDLMLPKLDGWGVLAGLRKKRKTPVLILTAHDTVSDVVRGLDTGADDYLIKPFHLAELLARLRSLIRRAADQPDPVIALGDVHVDTRAKAVTRGGQTVPLTAREYALVELLVRSRGALVSRTEIYDHLFDENDDSLSNLVEVHVSNIRKKLGREFIVTRRGQGYAIDA